MEFKSVWPVNNVVGCYGHAKQQLITSHFRYVNHALTSHETRFKIILKNSYYRDANSTEECVNILIRVAVLKEKKCILNQINSM